MLHSTALTLSSHSTSTSLWLARSPSLSSSPHTTHSLHSRQRCLACLLSHHACQPSCIPAITNASHHASASPHASVSTAALTVGIQPLYGATPAGTAACNLVLITSKGVDELAATMPAPVLAPRAPTPDARCS
eukprot:183386-Rhodomonas_salina.2